jgi:hypothetical protein
MGVSRTWLGHVWLLCRAQRALEDLRSRLMISKFERFWIIFILRFAFGFLFLFAAINIFTYGVGNFAKDLSEGFASTWLGTLAVGKYTGMQFITGFLYAAPYIMAALSVPILTGIFARPALRLGALLLLCFGLGKYIQNDIPTAAADFLFAFIICVGLYFMSLKPAQSGSRSGEDEEFE